MSFQYPPGGFGPPAGGPPAGGFGAPPSPFGPAPPPGYMPPPGYGAPAPGVPPPGGPKAHALNIVSLVLGLLSVPGWFCCYLGFPLGIAAVVCGILGIMAVNKDPMRNAGKGLAIGGIISAAAGFVLIIVYVVLVFALGVALPLISMP